MQPAGIVLIVIAVIAFVGVMAYLGWLQEKKRREELAAFAAEMGWRFSPDWDRGFHRRYPQFAAFQRGHSRYGHNFLHGSVAVEIEGAGPVTLPLLAGDYHYKITSGSGKNRSTKTYRFSFLLLHAPVAAGRSLLIRDENIGDKMKGAFGFDDIDFESIDFSDRFWVKSNDKKFAYDVIHPRMMEFLMSSATPKVELEGDWLCLSGRGSRWAPHEFTMRLGWLEKFFGLWPRHVVHQ